MSADALVFVLFPVILLAALVALALGLSRRPTPAMSEAAEAARRHGAVVNGVAWTAVALALPGAVGLPVLVAFRVTGGNGPYAGIVTALYPATAGLLFLAVHAIGERTWPRPGGPVRRAALVRRGSADIVPRHLRALTTVWAVGITVALVIGGASAAPGGRSFDAASLGGSGTYSPYPGWYYGAWLLPAVLLVLAATWAVLGLVARRPAIVDAEPDDDAASRRLSAHRVLRGTQLVLALTLVGVLVVLGYGPHNAELHGLGYAVDALAATIALVAIGVAVVPARRTPVHSWPPPSRAGVGMGSP